MAGCQEVAGLMQGFAGGDLPAGDRASVESHIAGCASCRKETDRLHANALYLQEVLGGFRMPAEFPLDFLLALPRKDGKRRSPAGPSAAPRTVVMGAAAGQGLRLGPWIAGAGLLGGAVALGWLFFGPDRAVERRDIALKTLPPVKEREEPGTGPADGRKVAPVKNPGGGGTTAPRPVEAPPAWQALRSSADLLAALRAVKGDGWGAVIARGWDFLAGTPAEAAALREAATAEKDPKLRAAMVLCLAFNGSDETRTALRGWLADPSAEVRGAAALGLARALSYENPAKRAVPAGPPLGMAVQVGTLEDDPARAELAGRLGLESDDNVRRVLVLSLGPTASSDPQVRDRILEGVKGAYGDELREACLTALAGIKDAALVGPFAEALSNPGTPRNLHGVIIERMLAADHNAAADALAGLIPQADGVEFRRTLVEAVGRAGGQTAESALLQALSADTEASVRLAAVQALQRYPSRASLDAAQSASENDADQSVRVEADRVAKILRPGVEKAEGGGQDGEAGGGGGDPEPAPEGGDVR